MNRLQKREAIIPQYGNLSIFELCEYWHSIIVGSSDGHLTEEELNKAEDFLLTCLNTWEPSLSKDADLVIYDDCVKAVAAVTITLIRKYRKGKL